MVQPFPAPSLRELLSAAKLRECRPLVASGQWFFHSFLLALKFLSDYVHRGTLPQSRFRSTAPSGREPGTPSSSRVPFIVTPGNRNVAGDFHRPYEITFYCAVKRAARSQMWAAASLGMCWRWDWRMWASWAGLSSRARAFSSSPRRRTAGTAMEVST